MSETPSARNPSWSRDELILTLDLYLRFEGNPPGKASKDIVELSHHIGYAALRFFTAPTLLPCAKCSSSSPFRTAANQRIDNARQLVLGQHDDCRLSLLKLECDIVLC
jgi:hypothetical protein